MRTPGFLLVSTYNIPGAHELKRSVYIEDADFPSSSADMRDVVYTHDPFQHAQPLYLEGFRSRPCTPGLDWINDDLAFDLTFSVDTTPRIAHPPTIDGHPPICLAHMDGRF